MGSQSLSPADYGRVEPREYLNNLDRSERQHAEAVFEREGRFSGEAW